MDQITQYLMDDMVIGLILGSLALAIVGMGVQATLEIYKDK